ncbi:MAG TPA: hypothetical protein VHA15_04005 [Burkholderiales bacterium]|nr:hypothetical protein [Burkholderiales bacterium]
MNSLPDPRIYAQVPGDSLAGLALLASREGVALQQTPAGRTLLAAIARADEASLRDALARPASAAAAAALERGIDVALAPGAEQAVAMHAFAFPILLVAGGRAAAEIPGVIADVARLKELLELHGALGKNQNVGLGNALVGAAALDALAPLAWRLPAIGGGEDLRPALTPEPVTLDTAGEQAYLRFLVGAALTPRDAPAVPETAANVGAWGLPWTRALSEQLAQPGLSLLAIPRPPLSIRRALAAGRFARNELGFQLFLSQAVRDFRARVGEPSVRIAAHADATLRIALSSPFDAAVVEYRWPLEPADDLAAAVAAITDLLRECRLEAVDILPSVQPALASH